LINTSGQTKVSQFDGSSGVRISEEKVLGLKDRREEGGREEEGGGRKDGGKRREEGGGGRE